MNRMGKGGGGQEMETKGAVKTWTHLLIEVALALGEAGPLARAQRHDGWRRINSQGASKGGLDCMVDPHEGELGVAG